MSASTVFNLAYKQFVKWFVEVLKPWIVEHIWPIIMQFIIAIFEEVMSKLKDWILERFRGQQRKYEDEARAKSESAEAQAAKARSEEEAANYRAIANVWHEVAERYRQQYEDLLETVNAATRSASSEFVQKMDDLDVNGMIAVGDDESITLKVGESNKQLQLPMPRT